MSEPVVIQDRVFGIGEPTILIAEISANHDRDINQALALVDIVAEAGWDCVKFQTYDAETLTIRSSHASMKVDPIWGADTLYDLYKLAAMPMEFHNPLFERAKEKNLLPFTTVYDPQDVEFVEELGSSVYKIASFELNFQQILV